MSSVLSVMVHWRWSLSITVRKFDHSAAFLKMTIKLQKRFYQISKRLYLML